MAARRDRGPAHWLAAVQRWPAGLALVCASLSVGPAVAQTPDPPAVTARVEDPRAFGHLVGDVLERRVVIDVPRRLRLIESSVPSPGRVAQSFELQSVSHDRRWTLAGTRHTLVLKYQVFRAPREPVVLDLPAFTLRFDGEPRAEQLRVDFAPVGMVPLGPTEPVLRAGFGSLRPDLPPLRVDTRPEQLRLWAYGVAALLPLSYLGYFYGVGPWWRRRQRPFSVAQRQLAGPSAAGDGLAAWRCMHAAIDATAGQVMHPGSVESWLAAQPGYAPLRADLQWFFERSQGLFFAGQAPSADDRQRLTDLCARCVLIERGAA